MDDRKKIEKVEQLFGPINRENLTAAAKKILEQNPDLAKDFEKDLSPVRGAASWPMTPEDLELAKKSPALSLFSAMSRAARDPEPDPTQPFLPAIPAEKWPGILLTPVDRPGKPFILENYFLYLSALLKEAQSPTFPEKHREEASRIWARINVARIFEVPARLAAVLYHEVDLHICREAGVEWTPPEKAHEIPEQEARQYLRTMKHLRQNVELPDLPFECIYLGLTQPIMIQNIRLYSLPEHVRDAWMLAFVVTKDEEYTLIETWSPEQERKKGLTAICEMHEGNWATPYALTSTPWMVCWIVDWINDHQTVIEEATRSFDYRRRFKKEAEKLKIRRPIPTPFYTVHMKDQQIREEEWLEKFRRRMASKIRQVPQHQYDVRAHTVVRYQRGQLPLEPKLEKQLRRDSRRKIFTTGKVDEETAAHLAKRGVKPKRVDEWMAVLIYRKKDHRRGPKDGPYIPSVRKSARKEQQVA